MNNRRKNVLIIFLIIIILIPTIIFKFFYHEQGKFSELKISKYCINRSFKTIVVSKNIATENQDNPYSIDDSGRSSKIFNYLNKFNFTEYKKTNKSDILTIEKYKGIDTLRFVNPDIIFMIIIEDPQHIELSISQKTDTGRRKNITKYYEINNGSISSKELEELLK